ncbi:hypothetical protein N2152v2_007460 [Parachlorella kessleri]
MPQRRPMVVAVSDDSDSEAAVQWILEHLARPGADIVHVVHIVPQQHGVYTEAAHLPPLAVQRDTMVQHAKGFCSKRFCPMLDEHKVEHTVEVVQAGGEAAAIGGALCDKAQQLHARLLVLAPHRKGAVKRILVGSVTDYCLSKAPCPVLIVKSQQAEP